MCSHQLKQQRSVFLDNKYKVLTNIIKKYPSQEILVCRAIMYCSGLDTVAKNSDKANDTSQYVKYLSVF